MTPGFAKPRSELPWLPYGACNRVIINAHNFTPPFSLASLEAMWSLNEASGSAVDSHGSNTLTAFASPGSAAGKVGNCRTFNGTTRYFSIASNASLSMGDVDFSFGGWFRLNAKAANQQLIGRWRSGTNQREWRIVYAAGGTDRFLFQISHNGTTATTVTASSAGSPSTGVWYWIYAYHDSVNNLAGISVNNATDTTAAHSTGAFSGGSPLTIAVESGATFDWLNGDADECFVFRRLLTTGERSAIYNGGNGLAYPFT